MRQAAHPHAPATAMTSRPQDDSDRRRCGGPVHPHEPMNAKTVRSKDGTRLVRYDHPIQHESRATAHPTNVGRTRFALTLRGVGRPVRAGER